MQVKSLSDSSPTADSSSYWDALAERYFSMPEPLVPSARELELIWQSIPDNLVGSNPPAVLVLGATPAFYHLKWPPGSKLFAVDKSVNMLRAIWPGGMANAECAEWTTMQLPAASRDIVLCDGGLTLLSQPGQLAELAHTLHRVLRPGGVFIARLFAVSGPRPDPGTFLQAIEAGRIRNSSELKLYLWMALSGSSSSSCSNSGSGLRLHAIWQFIHTSCPDIYAKLTALGWHEKDLVPIEQYKNCNDIYVFPAAEKVCKIFCEQTGGFELASVNKEVAPEAGRLAEYISILALRRI